MNRQQRRALQKNMDSETAENLVEKIFQFSQLPDKCGACQANFDKQDKDMVRSWSVVVRSDAVRLFCPECIKKTKDIYSSHFDSFALIGNLNESSAIK